MRYLFGISRTLHIPPWATASSNFSLSSLSLKCRVCGEPFCRHRPPDFSHSTNFFRVNDIFTIQRFFPRQPILKFHGLFTAAFFTLSAVIFFKCPPPKGFGNPPGTRRSLCAFSRSRRHRCRRLCSPGKLREGGGNPDTPPVQRLVKDV